MEKKKAVEAFLDLFLGEPDEEIFALISDISTVRKAAKQEMLFFEGDEGHHLFYLISGSVKLFKSNEEGKEAIIRFVEPGDIFAEIVLFLKNRYPVNATAIKASKLLAIDSAKLFSFIKTHPEMAMKLIGKLAAKSSYLVRMVEELTLSDAKKRFLNYLAHLKESSSGEVVTLPVPKGELSLLLGISPETFSRLLKKLAEDSIIRVEGKRIALLKGFE